MDDLGIIYIILTNIGIAIYFLYNYPYNKTNQKQTESVLNNKTDSNQILQPENPFKLEEGNTGLSQNINIFPETSEHESLYEFLMTVFTNIPDDFISSTLFFLDISFLLFSNYIFLYFCGKSYTGFQTKIITNLIIAYTKSIFIFIKKNVINVISKIKSWF